MAIVKLGDNKYLSTDDGIVITQSQAQTILRRNVKQQGNIDIHPVINKIHGRDEITIPLALQTRDGKIEPRDGFLLTVYLIDTNGSLKRIYRDEVVDPLTTNVVRGGFSNYIDIEVDV